MSFAGKYCCPRCKGSLLEAASAYACEGCGCSYPVIAGIADFRVYSDPYISIEADRQKGLLLQAKAQGLTFNELVDFYYSITPEVPADLGRYYANHHKAGIMRGGALLDRFAAYGHAVPAQNQQLLDLGCGTAGFLCAAARRLPAKIIGADIAFRWLIVARKRLLEQGFDNVELICACADYLPLRDTTVDAIVAENLIEHVQDQRGLFGEIARVRRPGATVLARTVNRFAFGPEPHVGVWGVGLLPRQWMNGYVKAVKGIPYEHIHLQSAGELRNSIRNARQLDLHVEPPRLSENDVAHHSALRRNAFKIYGVLTQANAPMRSAVMQIGPYLDVVSEPAASATKRNQVVLS